MYIKIMDKILITPIADGQFKIEEDVKFKVDGMLYTIPKGMETDLGSVPRLLRGIIGTQGKKTRGYILHDFFYRKQPVGATRKFADKVLRQQLQNDGVGFITRNTIYWNLRMFGGIAWKSNKEGEINESKKY